MSGRVSSFFMGCVVGAGTLYGAMSFHVVRAEDGHHFVPKQSLNFSDPYVDIRHFTVADWRDHSILAADLAKANKTDLLKDAASTSIENTVENTINEIFDRRR